MFYKDPFMRINHKDTPLMAKHSWYRFIATCGYVGHAPFASGTFGSLLAYPIYIWGLENYISHEEISSFLYMIAAALSILGWLSISLLYKETKAYDNKAIVIDELAGQILTLAISQPWLFYISQKMKVIHGLSIYHFSFLLAFLLFRFYDIKKPFFIKHIDSLHIHPFAVIADDLLAALFSSATVYVLYYISFRII